MVNFALFRCYWPVIYTRPEVCTFWRVLHECLCAEILNGSTTYAANALVFCSFGFSLTDTKMMPSGVTQWGIIDNMT